MWLVNSNPEDNIVFYTQHTHTACNDFKYWSAAMVAIHNLKPTHVYDNVGRIIVIILQTVGAAISTNSLEYTII